MKLSNEEDHMLMLCAFRYAMIAQGNISYFVIRKLVTLWSQLSSDVQSTIHTEINRAMTRNKINSADAKRWNHLLNMPIKSAKWERDD